MIYVNTTAAVIAALLLVAEVKRYRKVTEHGILLAVLCVGNAACAILSM
jgi:hypothetical protein